MEHKAVTPGGSPTVSHDEHATHLGIYQHENSSTPNSEKPYAEHGPGIDHKIPQENVIDAGPNLAWSRIRHQFREPLSEFFGVFILILFGDGSVPFQVRTIQYFNVFTESSLRLSYQGAIMETINP